MNSVVLEKLVHYYHENKISHAYLLETNDVAKCLSDLKDTIKKILCPHDFVDNCSKCNVCNLINQNYLPSLMIIEPDGTMIKKEQILELKKNFSSVPIYTKENVYVITRAEKLNTASANTMLKFIEEPEEHILGFFITNNINNVISTIRSRCEVLKVIYKVSELNVDNLDSDDNSEMLNTLKNYLFKLEVEKNKGIMYNRDIILCNFKEREEIKKIFKMMLIIYDELLKKVLDLAYKLDFTDFEFLEDLNSKDIIRRIGLITNFLDDIDSNVNLELLLDKFVIELGDNVDSLWHKN